jgi:hypothetical protein
MTSFTITMGGMFYGKGKSKMNPNKAETDLDRAWKTVDGVAKMDEMTWQAFVNWLKAWVTIIETQAGQAPDEYEGVQTLNEWIDEL